MSLIEIRKRSLTIETTYHEGGPVTDTPLKLAAACAVIQNPYAGRYEPDLMPFMAELRSLGTVLAQELVDTLGKDNIEVYSKAAIVGVNGEMEHGAVWHEAGGWAMRAVLGEPKAMVPASNARLVSFIQDSSLRFEKQSRAVKCSLKWHSADNKIHCG